MNKLDAPIEMKFLSRIILLLLPILLMGNTIPYDDCPPRYSTPCSPHQLEGFWYYPDSPKNTILRQADQVGEQIPDLGLTVHYDILWKGGCNHDFVVKQVYYDEKIPNASQNAKLFYPGEIINYQVTAVYPDSMKFKVTLKGITTCEQTLYRVPKEWLEK
ncbi:hypothetical protein [Aquimarina algiphila]|uniref:Uncharacterized protein n=1 Tax=Aquimarina algiphila TaxID=2047982 RepID=A0A554VD71_9FLAO|nr:hypothetical protein [Aquimarina algiphila]TSE04793.1 hypothetical protein FOF46_25145 [Aquimarina algiphila]